MIVDTVFFLLGVIFLIPVLYLFFLAFISMRPQQKDQTAIAPSTKFAIVIPAKNEAKVIGKTFDSIGNLDYPKELFDVYVIADNCSDDTAKISRTSGHCCLEREDENLKGKGHALKWALTKLLREADHDAFVIIDADTIVDPGFLSAVAGRVSRGAQAVQGYYDALHPWRSPMESLSYLGFVLSRNLRYKGRTRLGWTSNLLGNGMCFTRAVIQEFGWTATSIVEDIEYEMILHLNDIRVVFAPEAKVYAEIPNTFRRSANQRGRWDIGKFRVRNRFLAKLLQAGIRKRDLSYFDSAMELLIPPFSLFVMLLFMCFSLFLALDFRGFNTNFFLWVFLIGGICAYTTIGLVIARASMKIYLSLLYAPYFLLWRIYLIIKERFHRKHTEWWKTERK
jgi:cellulose synthase/poly-beta-1,6-N-acetylglucosamine synthase-like glycosyltransferase